MYGKPKMPAPMIVPNSTNEARRLEPDVRARVVSAIAIPFYHALTSQSLRITVEPRLPFKGGMT